MSKRPETGEMAPDFTAPVVGGDYDGESAVTLSELRGENVVLYFYPKDNTPGCTTQACALRDGWSEISAKAKVFGVSVDSIRKHENFIAKHELPFPLISDEDKAVVEAYGVWVEKKMAGRTYMGIERTTFVIGPDGVLKAVFPKVKPDQHLEMVLEVL